MKKALSIFAILFCGLFFASSASAQCFGTAYLTSLTWATDDSVHGFSSTELDYCAGQFYDPALWADFTENSGVGGSADRRWLHRGRCRLDSGGDLF